MTPSLRDIVKAECDSFPIPPRCSFSLEAVKHARARLGLDLKQAVDFVRAPAGFAPIDFIAERGRLLALNAQMLEALKDALFALESWQMLRDRSWDRSATPESAIGRARAAILAATGAQS
jgi:hypothetical protein